MASSAQYQPQRQEMPVVTERQERMRTPQPEERRPGGGGGGGGRGEGPEDEKEFSREEIAQILRLLSKASEDLFSGEISVSMNESSIRQLLVQGFELLAVATLHGQLPDIAARMQHNAGEQKRVILGKIPQPYLRTSNEMGNYLADGVITQIRGCLDPEVPR